LRTYLTDDSCEFLVTRIRCLKHKFQNNYTFALVYLVYTIPRAYLIVVAC
ncbi:3727_t:CDS:1, partial [Scutellospora calospora]